MDDASSSRRVVVTSRVFGSGYADPARLLCDHGLIVQRADPTHRPTELCIALADAVAWIAGTASVGRAHLAAAPHLRVIARVGVGTDAVDLDAANERGVIVTNTPGANVEAVADHALGLMLVSLRGIVASDRAVRHGEWPNPVGRELAALTVGIVGFGQVGRAVARRVRNGFGARVLACDPAVAPQVFRECGVEPASMLRVARESDVISLHLPGGGMPCVDLALISQMRRNPVLVNTARGDLVDEDAVSGALHDGRLGAYAADVFRQEPLPPGPLLNAPNVTLTPHSAAFTVESIDRMGVAAAEDVLRVLKGLPPLHRVGLVPNFSEGSAIGVTAG